MKIKISVSAYNEIATALERLGVKADGTTELTLEKGTQLSCPIDFKMVTIRRDVATIAAQCYKDAFKLHDDKWANLIQQNKPIPEELKSSLEFVPFCDQLMTWILSEEKSETKPKGWK